MVDVAVLKLSKVAGVTSDEWDSDGELELCKKFEVQRVLKRVLIKAAPLTEDVLELDSKPDAVLVNYKNYGYCRMRFDEDSRKQLIANLRYVKDTSTRTYIWRTFKDMIRNAEITVQEWFELLKQNLPYEWEEQTLAVIFDEILYTWKFRLLTDA